MNTRATMVLVILFTAVAASAGTVTGTLYLEHPYGLTQPTGETTTYVKLCTNVDGTPGTYPYVTCGSVAVNGSTYSMQMSAGTYYVFLWNDVLSWGSSASPAYNKDTHGATCTISSTGGVCNIAAQPRPLGATAANPIDGEQHAALYTTLKWRIGHDSDRDPYQKVYDIWGHGLNGTDLKQFDSIPCNAGPDGFCQVALPNPLVGNTYYVWHIVEKLYTGNATGGTTPQDYYSVDSRPFSFITAVNPRSYYEFQNTGDGSYLSSQNGGTCGGGPMTRAFGGIGNCEVFQIADDNGGDLVSGDVVHFNGAGWWVDAEFGGGYPESTVNVNRTSIGPWETFTIEKPGGGRIINGDIIMIKSYNGYYMTPEPWGAVTCNRATAGQFEQYFIGNLN